MRRGRAAAAAALVLLAAACGPAHLRRLPGEEGEIVEAEGWAPWDASDEPGSRRRALADAQRKAVEKVLGVYISAKTRVDAAANVEQRILAQTGGYVRRWQALSERREGGFLKTRIEALVLYKKLGDDLTLLGLTRPPPPPGDPRAAVRLSGPAGAGVRAALDDAGLRAADSDARDAALIVRGEAGASPVENAAVAASGLRSARARVMLEAVRASTGEQLAVESREASAVDVVQGAAADKALELAGRLAGRELARKLAARLGGRAEVVVRVEGLPGFEQARALADDVRLNPEVLSAVLTGWTEGTAEFRVTIEKATADDLAALLRRSRKFNLTVLSAGPDALRLSAR